MQSRIRLIEKKERHWSNEREGVTRTRRGERGLQLGRGKWSRLGERSASPYWLVVPPALSHYEPLWAMGKRYGAVRSGSY